MNNLFSIKTFNEEGLNEFERIIGEIKLGSIISIPEDLLFSDQYSEVLEPIVNIEKADYKNKNELIPFIVDKLNLRENKHLYFDRGLWTWLAGFFFDNICPVDGNGKRKINEAAYYVLKSPKEYTKYYRHLLAYYCRLFVEVGDSAKIFLTGTFQTRGEITEQLGASQEIALNKGILFAANMLYWNEPTKSFKRGAAGNGAGSARRFVRIIKQYQLTYDLNSMAGTEIADLLPKEFSKWKDNSTLHKPDKIYDSE